MNCCRRFDGKIQNSTGWGQYTERKTDPKSRYFAMFNSTFAKCSIQLQIELIQPDIAYDSDKFILNYKQYWVESNIFES